MINSRKTQIYCAIASDGLPYWHHTDVRASITNILKGDSGTSSSPTLIRSYVYDAYGETDYTTFTGGETFNANSYLAYTGAILDQQTGLYYLMSRYYDPKAGSFISQDSYKGEGEAFWHLYAYCDGDPVNKTDRNGNYGLWYTSIHHQYKFGNAGVGVAKSFTYHKNNYKRANCCGFALRYNEYIKGETLKKYSPKSFLRPKDYYNVENWFKATVGLLAARSRWVRRLSHYSSRIYPNERRVAIRCRTSNKMFGHEAASYDFHYLCQFSNGKWGGKQGGNLEYQYMNRPTQSWGEGGYNSKIIYFAVSATRYKVNYR